LPPGGWRAGRGNVTDVCLLIALSRTVPGVPLL